MHDPIAPPVGTIYRLSHMRWPTRLREDEYWQVERRTEKTVWMRQLVTDTEGKPVPGMTRTDVPLKQCRVLYDASLCIRKGRVHGPAGRHLPDRPVEENPRKPR